MKRIVFAVIAALALTGITTSARAKLTRGNIIRDGGFEITPEISAEQVWKDEYKGVPNLSEIFIHDSTKSLLGNYSCSISNNEDPETESSYFEGTIKQELLLVSFSDLDNFSVQMWTECMRGKWDDGEAIEVAFYSDNYDTLALIYCVTAFNIADPRTKWRPIRRDLPQQDSWEQLDEDLSQLWSSTSFLPDAKIKGYYVTNVAENYNSVHYSQDIWLDQIEITPTGFLTYDASIDSTEFKAGSLDVFVRNNGTESSDAFDLRLRVYDSLDEEVYNQSFEVDPLESDETEVATFDYSLNPGTYRFILTTGGLENFSLDQCSENDWKVFEDVSVGIAEQPETSPLISAAELQSGSILLNYSVPTSTPYTLSIFDVTGRGVHNQSGQLAGSGQITCTPELTHGVYFWQIATDAGDESGKFVWVR